MPKSGSVALGARFLRSRVSAFVRCLSCGCTLRPITLDGRDFVPTQSQLPLCGERHARGRGGIRIGPRLTLPRATNGRGPREVERLRLRTPGAKTKTFLPSPQGDQGTEREQRTSRDRDRAMTGTLVFGRLSCLLLGIVKGEFETRCGPGTDVDTPSGHGSRRGALGSHPPRARATLFGSAGSPKSGRPPRRAFGCSG